jgi:general secretion pathway protein M
MINWFEALEERERYFVAVGALTSVCALVYFLLWAPLEQHRQNLKTDVSNLQQAVAELRPLVARANNGESAQASTPARAVSQQSPIVVVDQTLNVRGLNLYRKRSQPTTSNGVRVEFENVSFDELILWLGDLADQHSMHVQAASFARGSQSSAGRINATLTLERQL